MRITIEGLPGELEERGADAVAAVRKLAGGCGCDHDSLEKAAPKKVKDQIPRKLDLPALQGGVDRASQVVDKIRKKMLADMRAVLAGAK